MKPIYGETDEQAETFMAKVLLGWTMMAVLGIATVVYYFVVMYKGYGQSVQSWGWFIFIYLTMSVILVVKEFIIEFVKKILKEV